MNFNRDGRELPSGQSCVRPLADERVNMLSRSKFGTQTCYQDLSSRPIVQNRLRDRLLLPLGRYRRDVLLMIFCVLFSNVFAQSPDSETVAKAKANFTIPFSFFMEFRKDSLVEKKLIEEHTEIDFQRYPYVFYEVRKGSIPNLPMGHNIDDFVLDMPLWIANDSLNREVITLRELGADGKIVVLDFWARWCSPCLASVIRWEQLHNDLKDKICVVSVNVDVDFWAIKNVKARSWKNTQVIGPAAFFLSNYFLGYTLVGPNVWLKSNRFFGASKATQKSYDFIGQLIRGEIDEIPEENRDESRYKNYSPLAK